MGRGGDRRARVRVACLAVPVLIAPQLLGGALGWTVSAIALLTILALGLALVFTRRLPPFQTSDILVGGALAWTGAQCIPLPPALLEWISPERPQLRDVEGLVEAPSWTPLTLDPGQTWEELVVGASIVASYALGRLVAARHGRRAVIAVIASSSFAMALVAFGHALAAAERVYGGHAPGSSPQLLAPLVNANHLGGFLAFGAHLGVGLALSEDDRARRISFGALAALAGVGALLAVSRGAVFSLALGFCWVGLVLWRNRGRGERRKVSREAFFAVGSVAALIVGGGLYLGLDGLFRDFESGDYSKLQLAARSSELTLAFPWAGVGRGAFGAVFASLEGTTVRFVHPENILAEWATEWGLPVALLLLAGLARVVWRAATSKQLEVAVAAGALAAFVAHDLVDYALEMPGVAVPCAALLGGLATKRAKACRPERRYRLRWVALTGALAVLLVALAPGVQERRAESFVDSLREGELDAGLVQRATRLHPLDPAIALWAGYAHDRSGDLIALAWYNRAMQLAPGWSSPHLLAADLLWRMGARSQAAVELREAATLEPQRAVPQACRYAEAASSPVPAVTAAPTEGVNRLAFLDGIARCLPPELASVVDERILDEDASHSAATLRQVRRLQQAGEEESASSLLQAHLQERPQDSNARLMLAQLRLVDAPLETLSLLEDVTPSDAVLRLRARAHAASGAPERMREELARLRGLAGGRTNELAAAWLFEGTLEAQLGNDGAALQAFERAHRLQPRNRRPLQSIAALCTRTGQLRRALRAYGDLCRLGEDSACHTRDRLLERDRSAGQRTETEALAP